MAKILNQELSHLEQLQKQISKIDLSRFEVPESQNRQGSRYGSPNKSANKSPYGKNQDNNDDENAELKFNVV